MLLNRADRKDAFAGMVDAAEESGKTYLDQFVIDVPDGLNTASVMEICRMIQEPMSFEQQVRLARICLVGKNVNVTCPNGEKESFCLGSVDAGLEGIPLFQKEPAALIAIADAVQGYLLKKYLRPSKAGGALQSPRT